MTYFGRVTCLLVCAVFSFQANADCVAVASDLTYEDDAAYDGFLLGEGGCLYDPKLHNIDNVPPVFPDGEIKTSVAGAFINGMGNTASMQLTNLKILANSTGRPMVGIRNAARAGFGEITEMAPLSAPVLTAADNIMHRINEKKRIRIWSSSQGTFYAARSVTLAKLRIGLFNGRRAKLDLIEMITTGGAAKFWPNGPRYVHYVNKQDMVPQLIGPSSLFAKPGRGAVFVDFDYLNEDPADGCADRVFDPSKGSSSGVMGAVSKVIGKILVLNAHEVCVHAPFFEDFDELRSFAKKRRAVRVDVPLSN